MSGLSACYIIRSNDLNMKEGKIVHLKMIEKFYTQVIGDFWRKLEDERKRGDFPEQIIEHLKEVPPSRRRGSCMNSNAPRISSASSTKTRRSESRRNASRRNASSKSSRTRKNQ